MIRYILACLLFITINVQAQDDLKLNIRAIQCAKFDFAELNIMDKNELESVYCSYIAGDFMSEITTDTQRKKYVNDPNMLLYIEKNRVNELNKCLEQQPQINDILERKFKGQKFDCNKYKGFSDLELKASKING